jgi:hypothetical protein
VVRVVPVVDKKASALADVSQEKSKLGLGDLYAEEYRRTALGVKVDDGLDQKRVGVAAAPLPFPPPSLRRHPLLLAIFTPMPTPSPLHSWSSMPYSRLMVRKAPFAVMGRPFAPEPWVPMLGCCVNVASFFTHTACAWSCACAALCVPCGQPLPPPLPHPVAPLPQKEVEAIFATLCNKLDALSNFHFTPKLPSAEIEVVRNVPAIAMEEVLPTAVNDRVMAAPEEVYDKKRGRWVMSVCVNVCGVWVMSVCVNVCVVGHVRVCECV